MLNVKGVRQPQDHTCFYTIPHIYIYTHVKYVYYVCIYIYIFLYNLYIYIYTYLYDYIQIWLLCRVCLRVGWGSVAQAVQMKCHELRGHSIISTDEFQDVGNCWVSPVTSWMALRWFGGSDSELDLHPYSLLNSELGSQEIPSGNST